MDILHESRTAFLRHWFNKLDTEVLHWGGIKRIPCWNVPVFLRNVVFVLSKAPKNSSPTVQFHIHKWVGKILDFASVIHFRPKVWKQFW